MEALSVYDEATQEAQRHRWIESQKHGRDLGVGAVHDWYRRHWINYCRYRHLEHLEGRRRWSEFEEANFGLIGQLIMREDLLIDRILDRVCAGWENLETINWALRWGLPIDRVIEILTELDINRARLDYTDHGAEAT